MRSMEAELRALRNELSNRNGSKNHTETQVMSTTVQSDSEDLDNVSDNHADEIINRRHDESPNQDINEDTDTFEDFEDKKLSIDLDKPSPENSYQNETIGNDELSYDEDENNSTAHNRHHETNRCDIPPKTSLDRQFTSEHNGSNGKHKHRNGKTKLSDHGRTNSEKEENDKETDSETASITNSREDSDEQSHSPIPPPTKLSKTDYNTINSKESKSQVIPSSRSYNNSNGGKGHTSGGISREQRQNSSDDKKAVNSDKKQLSSSSKVVLPPKKASSLESGSISSTTNRIHKSLKSENSRGKDKTE